MSDSRLADITMRALSLGLGMATLTKEKAEDLVKDLMDKGEVTKTEAKAYLSTAKTRGKELRQEMQKNVEERVEKGLKSLRIGVGSDLKAMQKKIEQLERRLAKLEGKNSPAASSSKAKAKKTKKKTKKTASARSPRKKA